MKLFEKTNLIVIFFGILISTAALSNFIAFSIDDFLFSFLFKVF